MKLFGYVAGNDLPMLLNGAHWLLFPSLAEGFGVTLLVAVLRGLPVFALKRRSLWELGQYVALFVDDPMDDDSFAAELNAQYASDFLRDCLSNAVVAEAQKYSWEKSANTHLDS